MQIYQQINGQLNSMGLPSGGGIKEVLDEISDRINALETQPGTEEKAGIVRLCSLADVTNSDGLALPASEKNVNFNGSLAEKIQMVSDSQAEWENISNSFYVDNGRNTNYEIIRLYHNKALGVAIITFDAGNTGRSRTWGNGEIIYKNNRIKSYSSYVVLTGFVINAAKGTEVYQLVPSFGNGFCYFQGLNSQGGVFTEAQFRALLLNVVID